MRGFTAIGSLDRGPFGGPILSTKGDEKNPKDDIFRRE